MGMNQRIQKHMRNFCFLLLTFATGLFYLCFYLVGITLGVSMAFTLVGLPNHASRCSTYMDQFLPGQWAGKDDRRLYASYG